MQWMWQGKDIQTPTRQHCHCSQRSHGPVCKIQVPRHQRTLRCQSIAMASPCAPHVTTVFHCQCGISKITKHHHAVFFVSLPYHCLQAPGDMLKAMCYPDKHVLSSKDLDISLSFPGPFCMILGLLWSFHDLWTLSYCPAMLRPCCRLPGML